MKSGILKSDIVKSTTPAPPVQEGSYGTANFELGGSYEISFWWNPVNLLNPKNRVQTKSHKSGKSNLSAVKNYRSYKIT